MPVIGHALVGMATAASLPPDNAPRAAATTGAWRRSLWPALVVVVAYLPDIVAQTLTACGVRDVSRLTHSIGFACVAVPVTGLALAAFVRAGIGRAMLVTILSIGLHIGLDVLQGTDRAILWPLWSARLSLPFALVPRGLAGEFAVTAAALGLLAVATRGRVRLIPSTRVGPAAVILAILGLAVVTHAMRDYRERQLRTAKYLIEQRHEYRAALPLLDGAERWPSAAKPGRVEYLRASALAALHDRPGAERSYLEAYAADPGYFWTVADLALFYASANEPRQVRRISAAPYIALLKGRFAGHRETPETLDRVARRLGDGP